ncbi:MAG: holin [Eubacterium sp.]|jgi:hypothetical protein|nr:holin [Eubacterium sp.]
MRRFLLDTLERAVKTAAQSAIAAIGTNAVLGVINWKMVFSVSAVSAIISALTSIASHGFGEVGTASIINVNKDNNTNLK